MLYDIDYIFDMLNSDDGFDLLNYDDDNISIGDLDDFIFMDEQYFESDR